MLVTSRQEGFKIEDFDEKKNDSLNVFLSQTTTGLIWFASEPFSLCIRESRQDGNWPGPRSGDSSCITGQLLLLKSVYLFLFVLQFLVRIMVVLVLGS